MFIILYRVGSRALAFFTDRHLRMLRHLMMLASAGLYPALQVQTPSVMLAFRKHRRLAPKQSSLLRQWRMPGANWINQFGNMFWIKRYPAKLYSFHFLSLWPTLLSKIVMCQNIWILFYTYVFCNDFCRMSWPMLWVKFLAITILFTLWFLNKVWIEILLFSEFAFFVR
jgi:hypothetical protein